MDILALLSYSDGYIMWMIGSLILLGVLCFLVQDPPLVNDMSNVDVNQFKGITRGGEKYLIENRKGRDSIKDLQRLAKKSYNMYINFYCWIDQAVWFWVLITWSKCYFNVYENSNSIIVLYVQEVWPDFVIWWTCHIQIYKTITWTYNKVIN